MKKYIKKKKLSTLKKTTKTSEHYYSSFIFRVAEHGIKPPLKEMEYIPQAKLWIKDFDVWTQILKNDIRYQHFFEDSIAMAHKIKTGIKSIYFSLNEKKKLIISSDLIKKMIDSNCCLDIYIPYGKILFQKKIEHNQRIKCIIQKQNNDFLTKKLLLENSDIYIIGIDFSSLRLNLEILKVIIEEKITIKITNEKEQ